MKNKGLYIAISISIAIAISLHFVFDHEKKVAEFAIRQFVVPSYDQERSDWFRYFLNRYSSTPHSSQLFKSTEEFDRCVADLFTKKADSLAIAVYEERLSAYDSYFSKTDISAADQSRLSKCIENLNKSFDDFDRESYLIYDGDRIAMSLKEVSMARKAVTPKLNLSKITIGRNTYDLSDLTIAQLIFISNYLQHSRLAIYRNYQDQLTPVNDLIEDRETERARRGQPRLL